ncbi:glycosyltransferase [Flavobacterium sp. JP2137]|uniref:glycosyltransferase n=1 Tax=Flavobacterium sp. JP2137 TaxID=3414510 RepID=UPI003D2FDE23
MKVVHIVEALGGGVYTYFKDLTNFFGEQAESRGIETTVIYSAKRKEIDAEQIKSDLSPKVSLIEVDMPQELALFQDLKAALKLRKVLKEIDPDVIHLHSSKAGVIGRWASFLLFSRAKVFYTPHGYSFVRQDISPFKQKLFWAIEKYTQSIFGGTTIACGDTEYEIAKSMGKAELVRNGVNFKVLEPFYKPVENERLKIGIVGRITAQKNPQLFNAIAARYPQHQFIWIGDGELRAELTATNIQITGWFLNNLALLPQLNALDVFLQTSLWEGLPIAVLEAMALRKPILATRVIGNKDVVVHGVSGFLFDQIDEIAPLMEQLEVAAIRKNMGIAAYEQCKRQFDKDKNFQELIPIYQGQV